MKLKKIAASIAAMAFAAGVVAKENDVGIFGTSGKTMGDHTYIDQNSPKADNIREVLKNVKMPAGFKIELYALVPDARDMAMAPQGTVLFVGTRKDKVWVVSDRDRNGVADEVKDFAPSLEFDVPNGVQFSKDGFLYIAERNHVRVFPAAEFFYEGPDVVAVDVVPKGELIPEGEESYNHTARVVDVGPDNKLYISLGQPYNVAPPEKLDLYKKVGIGGIIRMDRDGKNREVYTYGVRNSVGQDFHPVTGELWWTDNQVDGMGDDIPPGELNRQTKAGQHFGHPWFGGGKTRTNEYAKRPHQQVLCIQRLQQRRTAQTWVWRSTQGISSLRSTRTQSSQHSMVPGTELSPVVRGSWSPSSIKMERLKWSHSLRAG